MTSDDHVFPLDSASLGAKSVRGAAAISSAQVAKFCILLASQVLLARLLNPADFGIVAMVAPILGFVTVMADLGIAQAIMQHPVLTRGQLNSVFWVNNLISISLAGLLVLSAPALGWFYNEPRLVKVAEALAVLVALAGLSVQQIAILNRTMRFSVLAIAETAAQTVGLCASVLAAWHGFAYWSLVIGQAATTLTTAVIVWSSSTWRPSWPSFQSNAISMLKFGGSVTVSNIALYLNTVLDNVLVGYFLGTVLLGIYDRAWKLAVMPSTQLMAPISRVAVPALSRLGFDRDRYRNGFSRMLAILLFISLPGLLIGVVADHSLIETLFGSKWQQVSPVFAWLCFGSLLTPVNNAVFWLFVSQGRSHDQMIYGTTAAMLNILTYIVGVRWGLLGVTMASSVVGYTVVTPLLIWAGTRVGHIDIRILLSTVFPFVVASAGCAGALWVYEHNFANHRLIDLISLTAISYGTSTAVLAGFSEGRSVIADILRLLRTSGRTLID